MTGTRPALASLPLGLIRRSLLAHADGRHDVTSSVLWLQGLSLYCDLRRPADRPDLTGLDCQDDLARLDAVQLDWLRRQQGFAGHCTLHHDVANWHRTIDLEPHGRQPDAGRLHWVDDVLVETGVHEPYLEHWEPPPMPAPGALIGGAVLSRTDSGGHGTPGTAILVRVGDWFGFARDGGLPASAHAPEGFDREISLGRIIRQRWLISASNLPYREGVDLAATAGAGGVAVAAAEPDGTPIRQHWPAVNVEGELGLG